MFINRFLKDDKYAPLRQFVCFCLVGLSNVVILLITYYVFLFLGLSHYVSNTIGYIVSLINAYLWNVLWVFKKQNNYNKKSVAKFFIVYVSSYFISMGMMFVIVEVLKLSKIVAPIINIIITTPINFLLNKFWTFKD